MDGRKEIREFLASRRAKITPEQAGIPTSYGYRRVPGLRREEVALIAGVSVEYYTRLERGSAKGVSDSVLDAVADALQLDDAERAHLFDLARAVTTTSARTRRRSARHQVRPTVQRVIDSMVTAPAFVRNGRADILAANKLGYALYSVMQLTPTQPVNYARFVFFDSAAPDFFVDWDRIANDTVALLRTEAGRNPYDKALSDLVGELSTRSETFRSRWAAHNVRFHCKPVKRFHHAVVGDLTLTCELMELRTDPGLTLTAYSAEPGTPSEDALRLLASWSATQDQQNQTHVMDET